MSTLAGAVVGFLLIPATLWLVDRWMWKGLL